MLERPLSAPRYAEDRPTARMPRSRKPSRLIVRERLTGDGRRRQRATLVDLWRPWVEETPPAQLERWSRL